MNPSLFAKRYRDPARLRAARAHLEWLTHLDSGARLPYLHSSTATCLLLEYLHGPPAGPDDLAQVAIALGKLHGRAYAEELHAARLIGDFTTSTGVVIRNFLAGRERSLVVIDDCVDRLPAAIYKDTNLRNVVITDGGPAFVDFDDLTLAPFGYDLAKLIVSIAMSHGHLPVGRIRESLDAYNASVKAAGGPDGACSVRQFAQHAEVHHLLTARYLHRNGYRHLWPAVRPWPYPRAGTPDP